MIIGSFCGDIVVGGGTGAEIIGLAVFPELEAVRIRGLLDEGAGGAAGSLQTTIVIIETVVLVRQGVEGGRQQCTTDASFVHRYIRGPVDNPFGAVVGGAPGVGAAGCAGQDAIAVVCRLACFMNHLFTQLDECIAGFPVCRNAPRAADLHGFRTARLGDIQRQQEGVRPIKKTHVQFGDIRPVFGLPCLETSAAVDPLLCRQLRGGVVRSTPGAHGTEHEGFPLVETRLRESQDIADCQCLAGGSLVTGQAQLPGHSVESCLAGLAGLGFSMCTIGVRLLESTVGRRLNAHIQLQQGLRVLAGQFGFREFNATLFRGNQLSGRIRGRGLVRGGCMVQQGCQDHVRANFPVIDQFTGYSGRGSVSCGCGCGSRCGGRCCSG